MNNPPETDERPTTSMKVKRHPNARRERFRFGLLSLVIFSNLAAIFLAVIFWTDGRIIGLLFVAAFEIPFLVAAITWLFNLYDRSDDRNVGSNDSEPKQ